MSTLLTILAAYDDLPQARDLRERTYQALGDTVVDVGCGSGRAVNDPAAHNNLGFCLIPKDPERALLNLEVAARLEYKPAAINSYNRTCCHVALREYRDVFDLAEEQ